MSTLPTWAEYTAALDADMASYMVDSAAALGGLRIAAREDGTIVLDQNAVDCLLAQPEDADGGMTGDPQDGLVMWIGGYSYAVSPTRTVLVGDTMETPEDAAAYAADEAEALDYLAGLEISDEDIAELEGEARSAGDLEQVAICQRALAGDTAARAECARVIEHARGRAV